MKMLLLVACCLFSIVKAQPDDLYYWNKLNYDAPMQKMTLKPVQDLITLTFESELTGAQVATLLSNFPQIIQPRLLSTASYREISLKLVDNLSEYQFRELSNSLKGNELVNTVVLYYRSTMENNELMSCSRIIGSGLYYSPAAVAWLDSMKEAIGFEYFEQPYVNRPPFFHLFKETLNVQIFVPKSIGWDPLKLANFLYETGKFAYASPLVGTGLRFHTADPLFSAQWNLKNTGQHFINFAGFDINVEKAWEYTKGRNEVQVVVIDDGVEDHPDLPLLQAGFSPNGVRRDGIIIPVPAGAIQGRPISGYVSIEHGTACAGIIGAAHNNIGIAGIAPNCAIIPINISGPDDTSTTVVETIDKSKIIPAFRWLIDNDLGDVISCSWGGGAFDAQIAAVIEEAATTGRGGLGRIICFAAGNHNSGVSFPASLSHVIAVGATSYCPERKTFSSCDGEDWGSNYGPQIDIMAPGLEIPTTDLPGSPGYTIGDYDPDFSGTSAACPQVAGVVALMLSANRCLSREEVQLRLFLSAGKFGPYCYDFGHPFYPNIPWSNDCGFGFLNAQRAVRYALASSIDFASYDNLYQASFASPITMEVIGSCSNTIAQATYVLKPYKYQKDISFNYFGEKPEMRVFSNGLTGFDFSIYPGPPLPSHAWGEVITATETTATLATYIYTGFNTLGQEIRTFPSPDDDLFFKTYFLLGIPEAAELYLQNETVSGGVEIERRAFKNIAAGREVTTAIPYGDYVIAAGADVTFRTSQLGSIQLEPGFIIEPGAEFRTEFALVSCTQYPNGKVALSDVGYGNLPSDLPMPKNYTTKPIDALRNSNISNMKEIWHPYCAIFPNPVTDQVHVKYALANSEIATLVIYNQLGGKVCEINLPHSGNKQTADVAIPFQEMASGVYLYKFSSSSFQTQGKITKL